MGPTINIFITAKPVFQRKETLLQEYQQKNKSNMFLDKRIGEKDNNLSAEDKMVARFTAERIKGSGKSSIFNLGDDYSLTHGGEKLEDIDKFDNPKSDDEEEDELLNKEFVGEAHFGGFMSQADDEFKSGRGNSRKEYIENLIKESKKKKADKRKADQEAEDKTKELDDDWKNLLKNMQEGSGLMKGNKDEEKGASGDTYDMLVSSLCFEKKEARPTERLKTEEEKIKDERDRLQRLEDDRLRRMRGEQVNMSHQNVEDSGEVNMKMKTKLTLKERRKLMKKRGREEESEESEGEDEDGEEEEEAEGEEEESDDNESEEEEEDNFSDLAESDDEVAASKVDPINEKDSFDLKVEEMMETAAKEIPYVIAVPDSYEGHTALVWGRPAAELETILQRILSNNHPQLVGDKADLVRHFQHMLQYLQDLALQPKLDTLALQAAVTHTARLTALFQQTAAEHLLEVCVAKQSQYSELARPRYPALDTVIFLHLLTLLFPSSDYRHPVVTPGLSLVCQVLATARPTDRASLASCLVLCSSLTQAVSFSHRLVPELLSALHGLLYVASPANTSRPPPPCKGGNYLVLQSSLPPEAEIPRLGLAEVMAVREIDDQFRVTALHSALLLLIKLLKLYRESPAAVHLFSPLLSPLAGIQTERYPPKIGKMKEQIIESLNSLKKKQAAVVRPAKKVSMLRMMEPKIEESFNPFTKKRSGNKELLEQQKMRHKLKQERKGARKEIRQDTAFLASQKMKEARMKDADRQEKTKALFGSLSNQEGDYQKLLKKKKKF